MTESWTEGGHRRIHTHARGIWQQATQEFQIREADGLGGGFRRPARNIAQGQSADLEGPSGLAAARRVPPIDGRNGFGNSDDESTRPVGRRSPHDPLLGCRTTRRGGIPAPNSTISPSTSRFPNRTEDGGYKLARAGSGRTMPWRLRNHPSLRRWDYSACARTGCVPSSWYRPASSSGRNSVSCGILDFSASEATRRQAKKSGRRVDQASQQGSQESTDLEFSRYNWWSFHTTVRMARLTCSCYRGAPPLGLPKRISSPTMGP